MEQEDYLKKQIDQIGRSLGKILVDFLGLKNKGQVSLGIEITDQVLKNELDIDIQEFMDIPTDDFVNTLISEKKFTNYSMEKLAEIFLVIADYEENKKRKILYEKCLNIFEYLETVENTYSLERELKIKQIKNYNDI